MVFFTLASHRRDNTDTDVDISSLTKERGVIFFTYPKANTPGCTNQACGYRDVYDEIQQAGYDVYGVSQDRFSDVVRGGTCS